MTTKEKINKNTIPEGFSLGLAVYDVFPVVFFGIAVILLGITLKSGMFFAGGLLCAWAGLAKVVWKLIVVIKRKNIWWLFMQMRICMPVGFLIMIVSAIGCRSQENAIELWQFAKTFPVALFFIIGAAGLVLMGIAAAKLDSADAKINWIEQTVNTVAQLSVLIGVLFLSISVGYYHADDTALSALNSDDSIKVITDEHNVIFKPAESASEVGIIFYPGGKVEYTSYAPLMKKISEKGITCVLVDMPLNYAFLNYNAADKIIDEHSEIGEWYIMGHSLGGVFGSIYASNHSDDIAGMILLGSYSIKSLERIPVLSVYGSEDNVLTMDKYDKYRTKLPNDYCEVIISGGNHAMFGSYGEQAGDGIGQITNEEQWDITAESVYAFIKQ